MNLSTRQEAVNSMLAMIGASPVSSLSGSTSADVAMAVATLDEVSREVQSAGWHFNREYEVLFSPDAATNYIDLPSNVLRIDVEPADARTTTGATYIDVVQRGTRLYDKKAHTYEFTRDVKATVIYGFEWDSLPQPLRTYITIKAGRTFSDRMVGSSEQHKFNTLAEGQALLMVRNWDAEMADHSVFDHWDVYRIINRQGSPNVL